MFFSLDEILATLSLRNAVSTQLGICVKRCLYPFQKERGPLPLSRIPQKAFAISRGNSD